MDCVVGELGLQELAADVAPKARELVVAERESR
jgi:hypothetical protein